MNTAGRDRLLAINFAATIFVSAFLLFQVQPLVSKYILPWFGGSPAVWTTCMLFFQTLLFGGYAYAHLSQRWLRPRQQAMVHLALIVAAILLLRVVPGDEWKPADSNHPVGRILGLLAATVGLPYFVLSSTGPLVQAWFARSFPGRVPYRLYALSNVGSLLALLSYPFLFERIYDAPQQAGFWSGGFVLYAILCGIAAVSIWMMFRRQGSGFRVQGSGTQKVPGVQESSFSGRANGPLAAAKNETDTTAEPPWQHRLLWLALPAFASVTLLAATNHVSTDISPMPFLWVVPLSLYLLTFIIAFDHPRWYQPAWFAGFTLVAIYLVAMLFYTGLNREKVYGCGVAGAVIEHVNHAVERWQDIPEKKVSTSFHVAWYFAINFAAMFGICMLCHGELVRLRPHPRHLTAYYLMIAAGGALGGLAVSIIAPQIFVTHVEYKLALFLGYLLAIGLIVRAVCQFAGLPRRRVVLYGSLLWIVPALAMPTLLIAGIGVHDLLRYFDETRIARHRVRNFFGTLSVIEDIETRGRGDDPYHYYMLMHGGITHGLQFIDDKRRHLPTTYFSGESGVGLAMGFYRRQAEGIGGMRVGAVGLGTGTLAAYLDEGDFIRFYEINQAVIDIAEPGRWFTYLKDCKGKYDIKLGDARLSFEQEPQPQRFHVLVLDAFSGDAIPVHLLTEEAFEIYLKHVATPASGGVHGAIAVHISNRYLELEPVVRGLAERFNLRQLQIDNRDGASKVFNADWIILTRNDELIEDLKTYAKAPKDDPPPAVLWTDARSNLFDVLK